MLGEQGHDPDHKRGARAARACGLAENAVRKGLGELDDPKPLRPERGPKPGAGRKRVEDSDPELLDDLRKLVQSDARGDPEQPLLSRPRACARSRTSWQSAATGRGRTESDATRTPSLAC